MTQGASAIERWGESQKAKKEGDGDGESNGGKGHGDEGNGGNGETKGKEEDGCRGDDQRDGTTTTEAARAATSTTARRRRGQRARVRMPTARTGACMMEDNIVVRTRRREDSKMTTVMGRVATRESRATKRWH